MQKGQYPSNQEMANGLWKIVIGTVKPEALEIRGKIAENVELWVSEWVHCRVKYRKPQEKTWTVEVTCTLKKGGDVKETKEFDMELDDADVHDITVPIHRLPIQAFKSAVAAIINATK